VAKLGIASQDQVVDGYDFHGLMEESMCKQGAGGVTLALSLLFLMSVFQLSNIAAIASEQWVKGGY
jgi:hypothetical protein